MHQHEAQQTYQSAQGWLTLNEREALRRYAAKATGVIINVGVEYGASLVCLRAGSESPIIGFDIDTSNVVIPLSRTLQVIKQDSGEAAATYLGYPVGLAFIDGDHSYDGVMRDTVWADHIVEGGYIIFHDCYEWDKPPKTTHANCPDVTRAVDAWHAAHPEWQELPHVDSMRIFKRGR